MSEAPNPSTEVSQEEWLNQRLANARIRNSELERHIAGLIDASKIVMGHLTEVGNNTDWAHGDETDRVYAWHEFEPLRAAILAAGGKPTWPVR